MDITFRAVGSDQPETSSITGGDVSDNSGAQINFRPPDYQVEVTVIGGADVKEQCNMCFEDVNVNGMHKNMFCHRRYCLRCMGRYVESMMADYGGVPKCPHLWCNSKLTEYGCEKFLSSKWLDIFMKRFEEERIADSEKVYCPYPDCSFLMALSELNKCSQVPSPFSSSSHSSLSTTTTAKKCQKCSCLFCIECRVPWHTDMSCQEYAPQLGAVNAELNLLAENNKWKRCPNYKHMIEHTQGCMHIFCRCGNEFCYKCGIPWDDNCDCDEEEETTDDEQGGNDDEHIYENQDDAIYINNDHEHNYEDEDDVTYILSHLDLGLVL